MKKGIDYIGVAIAFLCHDGQGNYVMHKRGQNCRDEQGTWDFGGGGLKFGETIEEGLQREVMEEYGVEILEDHFLGFRDLMREHEGKQTHWICFYYQILVDRSKVVNNEPEKHQELGWYTFDNLPEPLHSMIPGDIEMYKRILV